MYNLHFVMHGSEYDSLPLKTAKENGAMVLGKIARWVMGSINLLQTHETGAMTGCLFSRCTLYLVVHEQNHGIGDLQEQACLP